MYCASNITGFYHDTDNCTTDFCLQPYIYHFLVAMSFYIDNGIMRYSIQSLSAVAST